MVRLVWVVLGKVGFGHLKTTVRCLKEGLTLLKASRPECHVVTKEAESRPEGPSQKRRRPRLGGTQGKNPMKHPMGSVFPWDVMGRLISHVFMVMGKEFPWEINFNHFLWEVL